MPDSGEGVSVGDLEAKLAGFVRSYIHASRGGDSSGEQEALRWVCTGLEFLLGALMEGHNGWHGWVDGIVPATDMLPNAINVISTVELSVRGQALWGNSGGGPFWIEPFLGAVQISETTDAIVSYDLKFADTARGLGATPYLKHLRNPDWFFPAQWLFAFSKGIVSEK